MKKLLIIFASLVLIVIIALVVIISTIDVSQYKDEALAEVEKATGRKASITGELDLSVSLTPAIVAEGISFANADWGSEPQMASIKRIEVQVGLMPLLRGNVEVKRFILIEPRVLLEKNAEGKANWELATSSDVAAEDSDAAAEGGGIGGIDIGTVLIENLQLIYNDMAAKSRTEFSIDSLSLESAANNSLELALKAALDNTPITVNGTVGSLDQLLADKEYKVDLVADYGPVKTKLNGVVKQPLQAKGLNLAADVSVDKLSDLNSIAKSELPEIGPFQLATTAVDKDGGYQLSDMKLQLAETMINGGVLLKLDGEVPYVKADFNSPLLDLVPLQPEPVEEEQQKVERYFTADPLPLEGLKAANADITFKATEIRARQATLTDFSTAISLKNGKLAVKPLTTKLAGGSFGGQAIVDASGKTAVVDVNLTGKQIKLGQLNPLKDSLKGGATDLTIRLKGSGNSSQAIAAGLNGKLLVNVGKADLGKEEKESKGFMKFLSSLGKLLNPISKEKNSHLSCAVVNFNIKNGMAVANHGIGVETEQITASGGGQINLKNEKMDLGFEPHAKGVIAGTITNLASAIEVGGTLADPKIKADLGKAAVGALKSVIDAPGSLVSGVLGNKDEKAGPDDAPCLTALGKKPVPKQSAAKSVPAKQEKSAAGKVIDKPKKLLKGLFKK